MQHAEETICFESGLYQFSRVDGEWLKLSQQEQTHGLIKIGTGQDDSLNRGIAPALS